MSDMRVDQVLNQMRILAAKSRGEVSGAENSAVSSFSSVLGKAVNTVNDLQVQSNNLAQAFELGDPKVSLSDVVIANQKSNLAFEATVQIRNKFLQAYQDIMNMPL